MARRRNKTMAEKAAKRTYRDALTWTDRRNAGLYARREYQRAKKRPDLYGPRGKYYARKAPRGLWGWLWG